MTSSEKALPRSRTVDLVYMALFAVLMAVCAWITIPLTVPFTLQTFAVFMALATLGGRRGTCAVVVYLLLGAVGLPVFSGMQGGLGVLLGATGGYIAGFLASALTFWGLTAWLGTSLPAMVLSCAAGLAVCYAFGTAWFLVVYAGTAGPIGLGAALGMCVLPFIVPDLFKIALALSLSRRIRAHLR